MQRRGAAWVAVAVAIAALCLAIARDAWPWMADDAFISMRYADRLLAGDGLTWNDGERVEGYSNLSWVLLTAGLGALGLDLVTAVRVLGVASTVAALALLAFGMLRGLPAVALVATVLLGAQATTGLWAIGGLEAPLAMACVGAGALGLVGALDAPDPAARRRRLFAGGLAFALLVLTRPDGPLWIVTAAIVLAVCRGRAAPAGRWSGFAADVLWIAAPALLAFAAQTGFRVVYYGDWVSNTTRAKLSPALEAVPVGLDYFRSGFEALRSLWAPALLGVWFGLRDKAARPLVVYALVTLPLWCAYIVSVGGDYFPKNRVLVPTLVPIAALAGHGFAGLWHSGGAGRIAAVLTALGCVVWARVDARWLPTVRPPAPRINRQELSFWEWYGVAEGRWLKRAFGDAEPLLAMDQVGAVPYASGLPCIDMLGLCDREIAATPVRREWRGTIGHARGNGDYVLDREPDLVLFLPPPHSPAPSYASGVQMEDDPRFLRDYRIVLFGPRPTAEPIVAHWPVPTGWPIVTGWVRVMGRIGCQRLDGDLLRVPGYLLGSYRQPRAFHLATGRLGPGDPGYEEWLHDLQQGWNRLAARDVVAVLRDEGRVVGEVRNPGRHQLRELPLEAGRYRLAHAPLPEGVEVLLREPGGAPFPVADGVWSVAQTGFGRDLVDVELVVPEGTALPFDVAHVDVVRVR